MFGNHAKLMDEAGSGDAGGAGGGAGGEQGAGVGDAGTGGAAGTGANATWYSGFDADTQGWVQNRGYHNLDATAALAEVTKGYRNAEKFLGVPADKLVRLPTDNSPEAWGAVWDKLGRPSDASKYEVGLPEGFADDGLTNFLKGTFHKIGVTGEQAKQFSQELAQHMLGRVQAFGAQQQEALAADAQQLKTEWGSQYDANTIVAKRAVATFGIDGDTVDKLEDALGYSGVMKLLHNIGSKLGESEYVSTGSAPTGFGLTKDAAVNEISRLRGDAEFAKKLTAGDSEARAKWDRLHQVAYSN